MPDGPSTATVPAPLADCAAVIFDLDGVVTDTASVHAAAWKAVFDDLLRARAGAESTLFNPFDADRDYRRHVDGRDRYDGVAGFLRSRAITLPWGSPDDPPEAETVCGVGNRKNGAFLARLERDGVEPFPATIALLRALRDAGIPRALFSASRNARPVLRAAGAEDLFDAIVDGRVAEAEGLPGKPDPAILLAAAARVGARPERTAVVEDAIAGVQAGRAGGFGLVVGVDRAGDPDALRGAGADLVVGDLAELETVEAVR
jgi:beta-phosphoglucomutase family hydrolase